MSLEYEYSPMATIFVRAIALMQRISIWLSNISQFCYVQIILRMFRKQSLTFERAISKVQFKVKDVYFYLL